MLSRSQFEVDHIESVIPVDGLRIVFIQNRVEVDDTHAIVRIALARRFGLDALGEVVRHDELAAAAVVLELNRNLGSVGGPAQTRQRHVVRSLRGQLNVACAVRLQQPDGMVAQVREPVTIRRPGW